MKEINHKEFVYDYYYENPERLYEDKLTDWLWDGDNDFDLDRVFFCWDDKDFEKQYKLLNSKENER